MKFKQTAPAFTVPRLDDDQAVAAAAATLTKIKNEIRTTDAELEAVAAQRAAQFPGDEAEKLVAALEADPAASLDTLTARGQDLAGRARDLAAKKEILLRAESSQKRAVAAAKNTAGRRLFEKARPAWRDLWRRRCLALIAAAVAEVEFLAASNAITTGRLVNDEPPLTVAAFDPRGAASPLLRVLIVGVKRQYITLAEAEAAIPPGSPGHPQLAEAARAAAVAA